jgi:hypothetical protein
MGPTASPEKTSMAPAPRREVVVSDPAQSSSASNIRTCNVAAAEGNAFVLRTLDLDFMYRVETNRTLQSMSHDYNWTLLDHAIPSWVSTTTVDAVAAAICFSATARWNGGRNSTTTNRNTTTTNSNSSSAVGDRGNGEASSKNSNQTRRMRKQRRWRRQTQQSEATAKNVGELPSCVYSVSDGISDEWMSQCTKSDSNNNTKSGQYDSVRSRSCSVYHGSIRILHTDACTGSEVDTVATAILQSRFGDAVFLDALNQFAPSGLAITSVAISTDVRTAGGGTNGTNVQERSPPPVLSSPNDNSSGGSSGGPIFSLQNLKNFTFNPWTIAFTAAAGGLFVIVLGLFHQSRRRRPRQRQRQQLRSAPSSLSVSSSGKRQRERLDSAAVTSVRTSRNDEEESSIFLEDEDELGSDPDDYCLQHKYEDAFCEECREKRVRRNMKAPPLLSTSISWTDDLSQAASDGLFHIVGFFVEDDNKSKDIIHNNNKERSSSIKRQKKNTNHKHQNYNNRGRRDRHRAREEAVAATIFRTMATASSAKVEEVNEEVMSTETTPYDEMMTRYKLLRRAQKGEQEEEKEATTTISQGMQSKTVIPSNTSSANTTSSSHGVGMIEDLDNDAINRNDAGNDNDSIDRIVASTMTRTTTTITATATAKEDAEEAQEEIEYVFSGLSPPPSPLRPITVIESAVSRKRSHWDEEGRDLPPRSILL